MLIAIIVLISIIVFILIISYLFQVSNDLRIVNLVCHDKRAALAAIIDSNNLCDGLRPVLHNGWLAYIKKAYPAGADAHLDNAALGQGHMVVDDTELAGTGPAATPA